MVAGYSWAVLIYIWAFIFLGLGIGMFAAGFMFMMHARTIKKRAIVMVQEVESRTRREYNKIGTLNYKELNNYLATVMADLLTLAVNNSISKNDYQAPEKLYAHCVTGLLSYLGEDTVSSIEYYYGDGFVIRWAEHGYKLLDLSGKLGAILDRGAETPPNVVNRQAKEILQRQQGGTNGGG